MIKPSHALAVLAAGAAIAAAGCGGGDDSSSTSTTGASGASGASGATPLSQEEFISQGNAICADVNSQIEGLQKPTNDFQSLADYAHQGIAIVAPALEQFRALVPPEEIADQVDAYLDTVEQQTELDRQLEQAAEDHDAQQVNSLVKQLQAIDADKEAAALGLTECAKDAQPQG